MTMALAVSLEFAHISSHTHLSVVEENRSVVNRWGGDVGILSRHFGRIKFGQTEYLFWRQRKGHWLPEIKFGDLSYHFQLEGLGAIDGHGETPRQAIDNFMESFHTKFQYLVVQRPFEMNDDDKCAWSQFREIVDVEAYRQALPVISREYGEVWSDQPGRWAVRWESTGKRVSVDLRQFPAEFASYKSGQPFVAIVERDSQTMNIRKVFKVMREPSLERYTSSDSEKFAQSLDTNKDLPAVTLD